MNVQCIAVTILTTTTVQCCRAYSSSHNTMLPRDLSDRLQNISLYNFLGKKDSIFKLKHVLLSIYIVEILNEINILIP